MIEDELYCHRRRQWGIAQRLAIAQLQPGRPVGEGSAVAAQGVGRRVGGDAEFGSTAITECPASRNNVAEIPVPAPMSATIEAGGIMSMS